MTFISPPTILTHAGAFHADEIMAIALLEKFYLTSPLLVSKGLSNSQVKDLVQGRRPPPPVRHIQGNVEDCREPSWIIRTRSSDLLELARQDPSIFVLDVGGQLDEGRLNFDHHQASMTRAWDNGTPLSSTGLIWKWLLSQGRLSEFSDPVLRDMEKNLIEPLDAHDNGVRIHPHAVIIDEYNRAADNDPSVQLEQFEKALDFCRDALVNSLFASVQRVAAIDILSSAWARHKSQGKPYVLLDEPLPWSNGTQLLQEISGEQALMLGIPGQSNRYSLISLPVGSDRFASICPVPESWRGRMDFQVEVGGVEPAKIVFAHKTGFMCVIEGGAEQAAPVVEHVVQSNQPTSSLRRSGPG